MAEGFLRAWAGGSFAVASCGTEVTAVRPEAVAAMAEVGVDISGHASKSCTDFLADGWDWVITVCDQAREGCPVFPGARRTEHWSFEDPSAATGDGERRQAVFRRVRDEIGARVRDFAAEHAGAPAGRSDRTSTG